MMNGRRQRFVDEYLKDCNATQAAVRAGYSRKTARQQGARLLTSIEVKRSLDAKKAQLAKTHDISLDQIVAELKQIAFSDITQLFDEKGAVLPPHLWPAEIARAVADYKTTDSSRQNADGTQKPGRRTTTIKLHDKMRALTKLLEIALGAHGRPTTAVQINVENDYGAFNRTAIEKQLSKLFDGV